MDESRIVGAGAGAQKNPTRYRVYLLVDVHWSPPASVQDRIGRH